MVILEDEGLMFIHVPKCGGTSISQCFNEVANWRDRFVGGSDFGELANKTWSIRFKLRKHSSPKEICDAIGIEWYREYKKFVVTRNPVDRFISSYEFMVRHIELGTDWMIPGAKKFGLHRFKNLEDFLFSDFVFDLIKNKEEWNSASFENLEQARVLDAIKLYLPQATFYDDAEASNGRFEYFHLENSSSFGDFMRALGLQRNISLGVFNVNEQRSLDVGGLSYRALEKIHEFYEQDFRLFGYPMLDEIGLCNDQFQIEPCKR